MGGGAGGACTVGVDEVRGLERRSWKLHEERRTNEAVEGRVAFVEFRLESLILGAKTLDFVLEDGITTFQLEDQLGTLEFLHDRPLVRVHIPLLPSFSSLSEYLVGKIEGLSNGESDLIGELLTQEDIAVVRTLGGRVLLLPLGDESEDSLVLRSKEMKKTRPACHRSRRRFVEEGRNRSPPSSSRQRQQRCRC